jgi:hypothetical protein
MMVSDEYVIKLTKFDMNYMYTLGLHISCNRMSDQIIWVKCSLQDMRHGRYVYTCLFENLKGGRELLRPRYRWEDGHKI